MTKRERSARKPANGGGTAAGGRLRRGTGPLAQFRHELAEAREQQQATANVLRIIAGSDLLGRLLRGIATVETARPAAVPAE